MTTPKDRRKEQVAACPDCGEYHVNAQDQREVIEAIGQGYHSVESQTTAVITLLERIIDEYEHMHERFVSLNLTEEAETTMLVIGYHRSLLDQCLSIKKRFGDAREEVASTGGGFDEFMSEVMSGKVPVHVYRMGEDGRPIKEDRPHDG